MKGFAGSARLRSVALVALCALLGSSPVRAQPAPGRPGVSDRARTAEARRHFQHGRELLDAGSYTEAIAEFETALSLRPSPELLFNIAQAYRLKGDARQALETYKRFLELRSQGPIADEARGHIEALTRQIEDDERSARAREVERQRQDAERQRQDAERQRQETERRREDAERQREDTERQAHDAAREDQARRRRNGAIAIAAGVVLIFGAGFVGAEFGASVQGKPDNTGDRVGEVMLGVGLLGLIPYGTIKIFANPDLGPYKPARPISKGVAFTFAF